jgi:hypothetical protein
MLSPQRRQRLSNRKGSDRAPGRRLSPLRFSVGIGEKRSPTSGKAARSRVRQERGERAPRPAFLANAATAQVWPRPRREAAK